MNITRADKKNIQKDTAAAKKRKEKKFIKVCINLFFCRISLCRGYRQQQHRIHVHTGFSTV